jgi:Putative Se/S carrier protein-like
MKKPRFLDTIANQLKNLGSGNHVHTDRGLLIFTNTSEVIRAETLLKREGIDVSVKGPPPSVRTGCDLAIEFPLNSGLKVAAILAHSKIEPLKMLPVSDPSLEPVSLFQTKDYGEFLMVRAANMKITISKIDQKIVNVSGGGCPDVPFLADQLVGKTLTSCPAPLSLGQTLCGYALYLAYEELKRQCRG